MNVSAFVKTLGFAVVAMISLSSAAHADPYCQSAYGLSGSTGPFGLGGRKVVQVDGKAIDSVRVVTENGQSVIVLESGHDVVAQLPAAGGPEDYRGQDPSNRIRARIYVQKLPIGMYGSPARALEIFVDGVKYRSISGGTDSVIEMACGN